MRIRQVKTLKGGERLAEPVITEKRETLISSGTILKPEYLDLISFLGIDTVCIEDPYQWAEEPHYIASKEKKENYIKRVQKILENHIYQEKNSLAKLLPLAEELVSELKDVEENFVIDMVERSGNLYEHTIMVTIFSLMVAKRLKVKEESLMQIALGCLLHDLGLRYVTMPYINDNMEDRPAAETFEYKKHTIYAYSALEGENWISPMAKNMVLFHHERKNGSGFPLRQKAMELECSILQACDAFDCAISGMECRQVSILEALEYLVETADVLFERKIVTVIEELVARYPVGTRVRLNTGEMGIVIRQTQNSIRPVIAVLDQDEKLTDITHYLDQKKEISILQVEN